MADRFAAEMDCAIAFVHHATKGSQAEKSVVDMGSGGGAQARAVDAHIVLRPHSLDGHAVMEAAVRSFPAVEPQTLRYDFPLWSLAAGITPEVAKGGSGRESRRQCLQKLETYLSTCGEGWVSLSRAAKDIGTKSDRTPFREAVDELKQRGLIEITSEYCAPQSRQPSQALRKTPGNNWGQ
ncbi:MAG UNVERIFIED_CONTAM: helicase RepA family protein [Planctomycetaceae bacterium]|jgi:hypothetical protein